MVFGAVKAVRLARDLRMKNIRFSLRFLLSLWTIAIVAAAFFSQQFRAAQRQRNVVQVLESLGADVYYEWPATDGGKTALTKLGFDQSLVAPSEPAWLRDFLGIDFFHPVVRVRLCHATDMVDDFHLFQDLKSLQYLTFVAIELEPKEVEHLAQLSDLEILNCGVLVSAPETLKRLRSALPKTEIKFEGPFPPERLSISKKVPYR